MPKFKIEGGSTLTGTINVGGAKNSAVGLIPAAILSDKTIIYNVPKITDINYLIKILKLLNCEVEEKDNNLYIDSTNIKYASIPEELSREMRASYYFMGAMLARFGKSEISFPGGCKLGNSRPIDLHLKGFKELGVKVSQKKGCFTLEGSSLVGKRIYLNFASVGATINLMLAATGAEGITIIENAAREPEIVNIASFLINMGADIEGAGTSTIRIKGKLPLTGGVIEVFPDRIEACTYLIAGAMCGKDLKIKGVIKEHIDAVLTKLKEMNVNFKITNDEILISKCENLVAIDIQTLIYPGFPTDVQQPLTALLTQATGKSKIVETVYSSRFNNAPELNKMGANTSFLGNELEVIGPTKLKGADVVASDLRAGACLVLAGLIADGITIIDKIDYILRGYESIVEKLSNVGAKIKIIE